jgi:DNA-binding SARP family transcriptional activator/tetratricopeptide (TPR) repeat protein
MAEFRVLGAVELRAGGRELDAGPPKQRAVFAVLVVNAGAPVPADTLVDRVWGESPPAGARNALYVQITGIRRLLAAAARADGRAVRLERRAGGYVLDVDPDDVDLHRFDRLVERARDPRCELGQRLELLREAIGLWRGEPLAGIPGEWAARTRQSLRGRHLDAVLAWAQAELRIGNAAVLIAPLSEMIAEHPLAEPLTATLMRTLVAGGRQAEALDLYATTRDRLIDELGTEPGPELRELHQAILRGEPEQSTSTPAPRRPAVVPRQLPAAVTGFAGRTAYLRRLDGLLPGRNGTAPTAVVISAIAGTAGIGKTALAVHWAHRVADRFPDGQLYVDLRGFDPGGSPLAPADAVRGLLDALGAPPAQIPAGMDAQTALYRSLLAGKRVLVVLDNARDAEQVRPLLPGAPGCLALVTSRNQLSPLVAADGAHPLTLDVLPMAEARELLARRLGADRVAAEPEAVDRIITACARLPLALSIAAARAQQTGFSLTGIAAELDAAGPRLDVLDAGEAASQVRSVFSWSYTALAAPAARLFRLLGLHAGPDVSVAAVASLAGLRLPEARRLLAELARASLLTEQTPGRYAFHDLLRVYASDVAHLHDDDPTRRMALTRLLDHYTHTAHHAARLLHPQRDPMPRPLVAPSPDASPEHLADYQEAMAWLNAERPVLIAALQQAVDAGFHTHAWQLAWALDGFLLRRGHRHDLAVVWQAGLHAARRLADPVAQASAHRCLAHAASMLDRYDEAHTHHQHALDLFEQLGERVGQADTHRNLAMLCDRQDKSAQAFEHAQQALALYKAAGHRRGQALALNIVGWYHNLLGEHAQALRCCGQALALLQQLGDRNGQAATWDTLGFVHHSRGHYAEAADCYQHSLALVRDLGDRNAEATVLTRLGDTHQAAGDPAAARAAWLHALDLLAVLDHVDVDTVRAKLRQLDQQPATTPAAHPNPSPRRHPGALVAHSRKTRPRRKPPHLTALDPPPRPRREPPPE